MASVARHWRSAIGGIVVALGLAAPATAADPLPLFDGHLHYNAAATAQYPLDAVFVLLKEQGIRTALASSTPNDGTRALAAASGREGVRIVPFLRPYTARDDRATWFSDPQIFKLVERELERGIYRGIGEFHLSGKDATSPWVKRMVDLAAAKDLWLHAHADEAAIDILLAHDPRVGIIWAHSGFTTAPETLERYFERFPRLIGELSYRHDVTTDGILTPAWKRLLTRFADRFLIGTDTWVNARWEELPAVVATYRGWLAQLPPEVAERIAWKNGERLFPP